MNGNSSLARAQAALDNEVARRGGTDAVVDRARRKINGADRTVQRERREGEQQRDAQGRHQSEDAAVGLWTLPAPISPHEYEQARLAPRCVVENYLFADVANIVAPGGTSKTTLGLFEAVHIVLGRTLFGLRVVHPGPVLIVTAEDRRELLVARLREICRALALQPTEVARVWDMVRIDDRTASIRRLTAVIQDAVTGSGFAEEIVTACQAQGFMPSLVQFDPMVSFGVGEARVNDAEQGLIEAARVIVAGLDCCCRFVHHTGKGAARDRTVDQYAGRGGSALADGCRMVHVLRRLNSAELLTATGDDLRGQQSALVLERPKLSFAPPQPPIFVRRDGFAFETLSERLPITGADRARTVGEQLGRFLESQYLDGHRHTRHTLEQLGPESLSRQEVRAGLAWLQAAGLLLELDVLDEDGKRPAKGARTYLRVAASGEATARRAA